MIGKVTYHQQVSYCGKPRCKRCREGTGHGPYWYAYQTVDGRTTRTYIGKNLPPEARAEVEGVRDTTPSYPGAQDQEQATVRIYALGQFRLERRSRHDPQDWQTVTESSWQHQRVRALLGCLISSQGRKLGREQAMNQLWPDLDADTAASRLDRAVYSLRQLFEPNRSKLATSPLLLTEREVLVLAEQQYLWLDADAFEHLLSLAHQCSDAIEKEQLLEDAMTLYGGDFLPEERRNEGTLARREALQRGWIGMLLELSDLRSRREAFSAAIDPLDRLLAVDPTNEAAVQRLILLLAQLGRRGEALRAYKRLYQVLQHEYSIAPLPLTRKLYEQVRSMQSIPVGTSLAEMHERLSSGKHAPTTQVPPRPDVVPTTMQIGRSHQSPLVGREQELGLLRDLVTKTEQAARIRVPGMKRSPVLALDTQRQAQCILLMGEVGIGKTRLAEEVGREAKKRGWAVAWSRVYAQEGSIPYRLWTEILKRAMEQSAWQRQELSRRPLVFQPLTALLPDLQPYIPPSPHPTVLPPEQEQLRLWEATRELLLLISDNTPLLIALDDLQWSDASSCELLAYLARRVQNLPIVIIGTCRDNELPADHPLRPLLTDLQREHAIECLPLEPLSDEQINQLVLQSHIPEALAQRIRSRAAGNPFFAEELARTFGSQLDSTNGHVGDGSPLPETITAVLDLRLGRLSPACQRLLSKAAVLRGSFQFHVLSAMESTPDYNEDIVLDLVEEALKSGMLTEQGTGTRITYDFWHPLLGSHLYEKLSATRRASLHRRAAAVLKEVYQGREEEGAADIAHHLVEGGADSQQIVYYAEMAANRAYRLSSYPEAEKYYKTTVQHIEPLSQADEQLHLAYVLECLGDCVRIQGKYEEARQFFEQALETRQLLYKPGASTLDQQEAELQAMLCCEIGWTWYDVGNNAQARVYYERAEQILKDSQVLTSTIWGMIRLRQSYSYWREGLYDDARPIAEEALKLFEEVISGGKQANGPILPANRIRRTLVGDPVDLGRVHGLLGLIANGAGNYKEALNYLHTALALYEQYDCTREIAVVCCNLGDVYLRKAEYSQAQAVLRRSLSLAERIGELPLVSFVYGNLGVLDMRIGNLLDSEAELRRAAVMAKQLDDPISMSIFYAYLATALQEQGKLSETGIALHRALTIGRAMHISPCIGRALVALGSMRVAQASVENVTERNDIDANEKRVLTLKRAEHSLQRALELEGLEAETRTEGRLNLARAASLSGEHETAQEHVRKTLQEAEQFELTWLAARARRLLGNILIAQRQHEEALQHFEQALRMFRRSEMRLEYARTLHELGIVLMQDNDTTDRDYQRGLGYLQEARKIFDDCKARIDLEAVNSVLSEHSAIVAM